MDHYILVVWLLINKEETNSGNHGARWCPDHPLNWSMTSMVISACKQHTSKWGRASVDNEHSMNFFWNIQKYMISEYLYIPVGTHLPQISNNELSHTTSSRDVSHLTLVLTFCKIRSYFADIEIQERTNLFRTVIQEFVMGKPRIFPSTNSKFKTLCYLVKLQGLISSKT